MSITFDPTSPADADSPRQGAAAIRALTLELLQLLNQGGGGAVTFSGAPFTISTSAQMTVLNAIFVPAPTANGHAVNLTYLKGQAVPSLSTTTTLVNSSISSGTNATIFTLTSTPPATPATSALYRAFISSTVYFTPSAFGGSNGLLTSLSDSATLFTNKPSMQNNSLCCTFSAISNATRTNAQGSVTFTLTGYAVSSNITINAASSADANSKSMLNVTWLPAQ